jgi:hypothetical protein
MDAYITSTKIILSDYGKIFDNSYNYSNSFCCRIPFRLQARQQIHVEETTELLAK